MPSEMVQFSGNGAPVEGYLAVPDTLGTSPGIVVIQEWWGLVPHIKDVTDRFAREGYVALAPDLYHGRSTTEPDEANKLMLDMKRDVASKDLDGAVRCLIEHPMCTGKVGVIGFCLGGGLALLAACQNPRIAACVDFYGVLPGGMPPCGQLQAPVLGLFGRLDEWMPPPAVDQLRHELEAMNKTVETVIYPGAGHAFFNDTGDAYDSDSARDAWRRTLDWFERYLKS
ncbi:MAG: dienelactone hydrolase family protein [Chloroflexi bacterium]|nr:dienelactone hydrolase family protein [Chloroflexota bacterium]